MTKLEQFVSLYEQKKKSWPTIVKIDQYKVTVHENNIGTDGVLPVFYGIEDVITVANALDLKYYITIQNGLSAFLIYE